MSSTSERALSRKLRRIANAMAGPLGALASIATIVMMIAIVIDVIARNIGGNSVSGLVELSESCLVATVFLGMAYAGATNAHVAVDMFTDMLPDLVARIGEVVMWVIGAGITAWYIYGTTLRALSSTSSNELRTGLMYWPLWPWRWIVVIGFLAFLVIAIINVILLVLNEPILGDDGEALEGLPVEQRDAMTSAARATETHPIPVLEADELNDEGGQR